MSIDFKGHQYPKSVILYAVFFYVRYGVSYRDLEEIMAERGVDVGHATMNRWVVKFSPSIASNTQARKKPTAMGNPPQFFRSCAKPKAVCLCLCLCLSCAASTG